MGLRIFLKWLHKNNNTWAQCINARSELNAKNEAMAEAKKKVAETKRNLDTLPAEFKDCQHLVS